MEFVRSIADINNKVNTTINSANCRGYEAKQTTTNDIAAPVNPY
jgi:hypothetical protein